MTISRSQLGKRTGAPPLRGPQSKGFRYKPKKTKQIEISDSFPRFKNGGLPLKTINNKIRRMKIG
tara:strand:+ start:536 stop:730 length:195 start_codon:yes stop_codon:yes gene_type:complete